jgi:hypothetical protein
VKVLVIILLACTAVYAQSRDDLRKKYGEPTAETFLIRPGIIVTASYESTGNVSELVISPQLTGIIKTKAKGLVFETVNTLVEELVPMSQRGKPGFAGFLNIGCMPQNDCYGSVNDYEKVFIYYNAGQHRDVNYAVIKWKQ